MVRGEHLDLTVAATCNHLSSKSIGDSTQEKIIDKPIENLFQLTRHNKKLPSNSKISY